MRTGMDELKMNDLERLNQTLQAIGYKRIEKPETPGEKEFYLDAEPKQEKIGAASAVHLGSGIGYSFFCCIFFFDKDGKFITHGCWE